MGVIHYFNGADVIAVSTAKPLPVTALSPSGQRVIQYLIGAVATDVSTVNKLPIVQTQTGFIQYDVAGVATNVSLASKLPVVITETGKLQFDVAGVATNVTAAAPLPVAESNRTIQFLVGAVKTDVAAAAPLPVAQYTNTTATVGTQTSVAGNAASVSLLPANTARKGATIYNDSSANLYVRLAAAAASNANFTLLMSGSSYYEVPFGYNGEIRGIWDSATGNARITEIV